MTPLPTLCEPSVLPLVLMLCIGWVAGISEPGRWYTEHPDNRTVRAIAAFWCVLELAIMLSLLIVFGTMAAMIGWVAIVVGWDTVQHLLEVFWP